MTTAAKRHYTASDIVDHIAGLSVGDAVIEMVEYANSGEGRPESVRRPATVAKVANDGRGYRKSITLDNGAVYERDHLSFRTWKRSIQDQVEADVVDHNAHSNGIWIIALRPADQDEGISERREQLSTDLRRLASMAIGHSIPAEMLGDIEAMIAPYLALPAKQPQPPAA